MARLQLLLCFTILFASVTLLDVVSAHLKTKPSLPPIEDPKTVKDVETYTVNVVMVFVSNLEKECPKTNKFSAFFERLRGFAKYVCPISSNGRDLKAKAGSLFQAISSLAVGKIKEEIQEEKLEAMDNLKWMESVAGKILGGHKNDESEESMKLTSEQVKEIKEGILKWQTVITKITNTMVESITTTSSSEEESTITKGSSSSDSGGSFEDTTGSSSDFDSPIGSPSISPSGSSSDFESSTESPSISPSGSSSDFESSTESPSISSSGSSSFDAGESETSSTDTSGAASPAKDSTITKDSSTSGSGSSFEDTTGSTSDFDIPAGGPSISPSGSSSDFGSPTQSPSISPSASETSFTDTTGTASPAQDSTVTKDSSTSDSGSSFEDTTGSSADFESPIGSPSISPFGSSSDFGSLTGSSSISPSGSSSLVAGESEASLTDTTDTTSPVSSPSSSSSSSDTKTAGSSESSEMTLTEVETDTSKEVMAFLMNLEKKCPPKEEFKSFFEQLKATMTTASKEVSKTKKSFLSQMKSSVGKLSDVMTFMMSRIGSKSIEVKQSLETYQGEVMKAVQELEAIHSQILSQNKGKKDGTLTCTPAQQKEIQVTITKWEQVTSKFVETAIQSETQSSTTTTSTRKEA